MKIKRKLTFLAFLILAAFAIGMFVRIVFQNKVLNFLYDDENNKRMGYFDKIVEIKGKSLETLVYDYSYWDEMVNFLARPDKAWIESMIDKNVLNTYKTDVIWIYKNDLSLAYCVNKLENNDFKDIILAKVAINKLFLKERFCHFFINTPYGLMEVRGATIHPTADALRKTLPRGYFFSGRLWNREYISELQSITNSTITITPVSEKNIIGKRELSSTTFFRILTAWDQSPLMRVNMNYKNEGLAFFYKHSRMELFFILVFTILMLIFILAAINGWISYPLGLISLALNKNDATYINKIKRYKNEFGDVAILIENFFRQRDELFEQQQKLRLIFDQTFQFIGLLTPEGVLIDANKAALTFSGIDLSVVSGKEFSETPWWTHSTELQEKLRKAVKKTAEGELTRFEATHYSKDGSLHYVDFSLKPAKDQNGKVIFLVAEGRDITDRKKAEVELKRMLQLQQGINILQYSLLAPSPLESKLKTITENVVCLFDADFCRIWLIRPGDLCEQGCVHAEVKEGPHTCRYRDKCLHLLVSSGRYTHIDGKTHRRVPFGCYKIGRIASDEEHRFLTNDAQNDPSVHNHEWARELGLVSFAGYQLRVPHGETIGVLAFFSKHPILAAEDILLDGLSNAVSFAIQQGIIQEKLEISYTQLKRTQVQLTQSAKMSSVGLLASGVAHEINNPLTGVLNNVQLIKMSIAQDNNLNPDDFKELLDSMEESAQRCVGITRSLLDFGKPSKGIFQSISVKEIIGRVLILVKHDLEMRNIIIQRDIETNTPEIKCDPQLLQQAIFDIIANARWAIQKNSEIGGIITIKTRYEQNRNTVNIYISDTGIGISDDNLKRIFEPFFTSKDVGEGTGLGLFMVYNIIKDHKGNLEVESKLGQGTTFKISLPVV